MLYLADGLSLDRSPMSRHCKWSIEQACTANGASCKLEASTAFVAATAVDAAAAVDDVAVTAAAVTDATELLQSSSVAA